MNALENFRSEIDAIDAQLIRVLGARFELCRQIAEFKKEQMIPMMQPGRVEEVKRRCAQLGAQYGVNPELVMQMYGLIINESCRVEDEIIGVEPDTRAEVA